MILSLPLSSEPIEYTSDTGTSRPENTEPIQGARISHLVRYEISEKLRRSTHEVSTRLGCVWMQWIRYVYRRVSLLISSTISVAIS